MKQIFRYSALSLFLLLLSIPAYSIHTNVNKDKSTYDLIRQHFTAIEIAQVDAETIENTIGRELNWKEKYGLRTAQFKIKKWEKKGMTAEEIEDKLRRDDFSFSFLGFILGFFLSLIGIIIAWVIWGRRGLISGLYGALFSLVLGVIYALT